LLVGLFAQKAPQAPSHLRPVLPLCVRGSNGGSINYAIPYAVAIHHNLALALSMLYMLRWPYTTTSLVLYYSFSDD
jgi:hypothetical protein